MRKWLIIAGFVGAFAVGSLTSGAFNSSASTNSEMNDTFNNRVSESRMMNYSQGLGMMNHPNGANMMANMHGKDMMDTMSIMDDVMTNLFGEAAKTLGMTTDQLQTELQSGKPLDAISEEQGIVKDELVKNLEDVIHQDFERLKKEGRLTTVEQEEMLLFMSENIGIMFNSKGMFPCNGFGEPNYSSQNNLERGV